MTFRKCLFIGLILMTALVALPQSGAAQRVVFRPYVAYGYGWGPALYSPYYYYPAYYPYYPVAGVYPQSGEVKIESHLKDASVYIDGGFVGSTGKSSKFHLRLGNHDIEVRNRAGQTLFHERVQVLAGKTVDIKL